MHVDPAPSRLTLRKRRRDIPPRQRMAAAEAVAERLVTLPGVPKQGYMAGYWAMDGELPLHAWQVRLPADCIEGDKEVSDPVCLRRIGAAPQGLFDQTHGQVDVKQARWPPDGHRRLHSPHGRQAV